MERMKTAFTGNDNGTDKYYEIGDDHDDQLLWDEADNEVMNNQNQTSYHSSSFPASNI